MISGQWFQWKRSKNWQKLHNSTLNSMENWGSTLIVTNFVGVHLRNIYKKFEANLWNGLREVEKGNVYDNNVNDGHRVIAKVTLIECD